MSTPKIEPAMTPEEWNYAKTHPVEWTAGESGHSIAARILYGSEFGFTHEEATLVEVCGRYGSNESWTLSDDKLDKLLIIALKIRALLPPENLVLGDTTEHPR